MCNCTGGAKPKRITPAARKAAAKRLVARRAAARKRVAAAAAARKVKK